jgi:glycosyltransferase involved in cell wall biosynthesis
MPKTGFLTSLVSIYYRLYARYNMGAIADSVLGRGLMWTAGTAGKALYSMGVMRHKPWFARSSMRSVRHLIPQAHARVSDKTPLPNDVRNLSDLRVASILDPFSHLSFSFECDLLPLSTVDWKTKIEEFKPHMLLVESAWEGLDASWRWKVSIVSPELIELIVYCRKRGIPTVFWNKEDPKHFETFIRAAELFDVVFTTDADKIRDYLEVMRGGRVYLLPFAAQPAIHNPIETYERADAFCFAGSYYAKQMDRNRTFSRMVRTLSGLGKVEIFDRYMNTQDERLTFPERFSHLIVGTLEPTDIDRAYKGYYYGLNMNSVLNSQTMFSRRALELLASNTVVIGNYSRGLRNYLGDLTISTDDTDLMSDMVGRLKSDSELRDVFRLAGLRKVMSQHTYDHRLRTIVEKVFGSRLENRLPVVSVISDPRDANELNRALKNFKMQKHRPECLYLILPPTLKCDEACVTLLTKDTRVEGDFVSYMCPSDAYGPNYLRDLALAAKWSGSRVVGKAAYERGVDRQMMFEGKEYRFVDGLQWRRAIVGRELCHPMITELTKERDVTVRGVVNLSIDRFSYIAEIIDDFAWQDEETIFDQGHDVDEISERIGDGRKGFISHHERLRVFGRYPKSAQPFRAPYLHSLNLREDPSDVVCTSPSTTYFDVGGVEVSSLNKRDLERALSEPYEKIEFHLMNKDMLRAYEELNASMPIEVWVYGPEADLALNLKDTAEGRQQRMSSEDQLREGEWTSLLKYQGARFVFASEFLAKSMERMAGTELGDRGRIVHVLPETEFVEGGRNGEPKIIVAKPHWGAEMDMDALRRIVQALGDDPFLKRVPLTVYGDWGKAVRHSQDLKGVKNATIVRESRSSVERVRLLSRHAVLMMPLKRDANCALLLEGMAQGIVPMVSIIDAVPEFVDESCCIPLTGDVDADIAKLKEILLDPAHLEKLSQNAVKKARSIIDAALPDR